MNRIFFIFKNILSYLAAMKNLTKFEAVCLAKKNIFRVGKKKS